MAESDEPAAESMQAANGNEQIPALSDVVDAALSVGAAFAKTLAQATTSRPLPPPGERPFEDIVRYGTTAAGSLIALVVDSAQSASMKVASTKGAPPDVAKRPERGPEVTAGSTLRVPLMVENTSSSTTPEIAFAATEVELVSPCVEGGGATGAKPLDAAAVTFTPRTLIIAPRDFEKLTVRILTSDVTAPGRYRARVEGGSGWFATEIVFDVIPRAAHEA